MVSSLSSSSIRARYFLAQVSGTVSSTSEMDSQRMCRSAKIFFNAASSGDSHRQNLSFSFTL